MFAANFLELSVRLNYFNLDYKAGKLTLNYTGTEFWLYLTIMPYYLLYYASCLMYSHASRKMETFSIRFVSTVNLLYYMQNFPMRTKTIWGT